MTVLALMSIFCGDGLSLSVLDALGKRALVDRAVSKPSFSFSVKLIVCPLALVISSVFICHFSVAVAKIILPLALVYVAVCIYHFALSRSFFAEKGELSLIYVAVIVNLLHSILRKRQNLILYFNII